MFKTIGLEGEMPGIGSAVPVPLREDEVRMNETHP